MMAQLDSFSSTVTEAGKIKAGWKEVNITPSETMPMAGYRPRDHFESVHDSLFARIILLQVGETTVALINVDLLLFPPSLKVAIQKKLAIGKNNTFFFLSATHTHNGIGGWDKSFIGDFALGDFNPDWIEQASEKIADAIITTRVLPSSIQYWESEASDLVRNRIVPNGKEDGKLRGFILQREDSTTACFFSFSAHATSISRHSYVLSADYPGQFIKHLEKDFDFGMYMAGMVGSHSFNRYEEHDFELIEKESTLLAEKFKVKIKSQSFDSTSTLIAHVPIIFGPSQLRISKNWKVRDWVLDTALGELEGELTYLKIGNIIMIGTPCDFSGEIFVRDQLEELAAQKGNHLIITSFNGNYVGYITYDGHYDSIQSAEVREMNWVGPYYGEYFSAMIKKLITK
jgi:hypothetical protein